MFDFVKNLGPAEWMIILIIFLIFFGGKKLNDIARGMGESKKEISKISKDLKEGDSKKKKSETLDES